MRSNRCQLPSGCDRRSAITLSTVGFGEIEPLSSEGRVFTSIMILMGVGTLAYALKAMMEALGLDPERLTLSSLPTLRLFDLVMIVLFSPILVEERIRLPAI